MSSKIPIAFGAIQLTTSSPSSSQHQHGAAPASPNPEEGGAASQIRCNNISGGAGLGVDAATVSVLELSETASSGQKKKTIETRDNDALKKNEALASVLFSPTTKTATSTAIPATPLDSQSKPHVPAAPVKRPRDAEGYNGVAAAGGAASPASATVNVMAKKMPLLRRSKSRSSSAAGGMATPLPTLGASGVTLFSSSQPTPNAGTPGSQVEGDTKISNNNQGGVIATAPPSTRTLLATSRAGGSSMRRSPSPKKEVAAEQGEIPLTGVPTFQRSVSAPQLVLPQPSILKDTPEAENEEGDLCTLPPVPNPSPASPIATPNQTSSTSTTAAFLAEQHQRGRTAATGIRTLVAPALNHLPQSVVMHGLTYSHHFADPRPTSQGGGSDMGGERDSQEEAKKKKMEKTVVPQSSPDWNPVTPLVHDPVVAAAMACDESGELAVVVGERRNEEAGEEDDAMPMPSSSINDNNKVAVPFPSGGRRNITDGRKQFSPILTAFATANGAPQHITTGAAVGTGLRTFFRKQPELGDATEPLQATALAMLLQAPDLAPVGTRLVRSRSAEHSRPSSGDFSLSPGGGSKTTQPSADCPEQAPAGSQPVMVTPMEGAGAGDEVLGMAPAKSLRPETVDDDDDDDAEDDEMPLQPVELFPVNETDSNLMSN